MNGRCEACRRATSGRRDILCVACWPKVPTALKAVYRLVWRLVSAGLVMEEAKLELERIIIREAKEAIGALTPPAVRAAAPSTPTVAVASRRPSPTRDALLAALPRRPEDALSTAAVAERAKVSPQVADVTLGNLRRAGWPQLRTLNDASTSKRGRYRYWLDERGAA